MLNVKKLLTKLLNRSIHTGSTVNLGNVTVNASGYYGFNLGNSIPDGATVISFIAAWGSNTGGFSIVTTGTSKSHFIAGQPNCTITNLRLQAVYVIL